MQWKCEMHVKQTFLGGMFPKICSLYPYMQQGMEWVAVNKIQKLVSSMEKRMVVLAGEDDRKCVCVCARAREDMLLTSPII